MAMDRLGKNTFSHPVKVTMPQVARMEDHLIPLIHIRRLTPDRDKARNHTQELQTPRLMYKTQH